MTLYLSDLDGTLLNYASKIKPRAAEMLSRFIENGTLFSYATARSFHTASPITAELGITLPVITMNGVMLVDGKSGECISCEYFGEKETDYLKSEIVRLGEYPLIYAIVDGKERVSYIESQKKRVKYYLDMRKNDIRLRPVKDYDELFAGEIYYATLIDPTAPTETLHDIFNEEKGFGKNYQRDSEYSDSYWFEVFSKNASKAHAALKLKKLLGADELVVFGDNMNDMPMFRAADRSYAVSNAVMELKNAATGIIGSNEEMGVPVFIERETTEVFSREAMPAEKAPDSARFTYALQKARNREISTIGTLNEKLIHSTLKNYFTSEIDHEAKIGGFYADAVSENGIYEIQTGSFGKLNAKLSAFLSACPVTVVYPFEKRVKNGYINKNTGELIKLSAARTNYDLSKFFLELYRIKSFLTSPNLTVCIAELETEKLRIVDDEKCIRKRGQKTEKSPVKLINEIYLRSPADYRRFLPEDLPSEFTKKELEKLKLKCDASIFLEIMEYLSIIHKVGKNGNAFIYSAF